MMTSIVELIRLRRRSFLCLAVLAPLYAAIFYLTFWLRFEGELGAAQMRVFHTSITLVLATKCFTFGFFHVYRGWGRHASFHDLVNIVAATSCSTLLIALGDFALLPDHMIPRSVVLMDWGATIVFVGGLRAAYRAWKETRHRLASATRLTPVFIVGSLESAESLLRAMRLGKLPNYRILGVIADNPDHAAGYIAGVQVLGVLEQTCALAARHGVQEVLIASGNLPGKQVRKLVEDCRRRQIKVRVLPSFEELLTGALQLQPRPVSIEDLLRRDPVELEMHHIRDWIDDQVVMVTGSAGSIGSEVCRQLLKFSPKKLLLVDRWENGQFHIGREFDRLDTPTELEICIADINDPLRMRRLLMRHRPQVIFHAAAYKHVPLMEDNPGEAVKNTTLATAQLADLADEFGVSSFVMISTDKAVNPTNVMGACKRVAELYVQSLAAASKCRFVTVRFGNVLDSAGSVVPIFREQIARGGPVTVTDPRMERYFMTIPEAAQLVIQAGAMGRGGEIFVLDMGEPVRILDLATDAIRLSGFEVGVDIDIEFIGLRPGEKLFEELHVVGEKHVATRHPKIMVAECKALDLSKIRAGIVRLQAVVEQPPEAIISQLSRLLPEYRPRLHERLQQEERAA